MSFDFSTLVTDRTQADVNRVKQIAEKIKNGTASESELAEFNSAAMKGAYNHTDLNRVTAAMEALKAKLEGYGYSVPGYQRIKVPHVLPEPEPTSRLPEGYTELAWIESSGTQYVDTGFKPDQNTRVVMDAQSVVAGAIYWGCRASSSSTDSKAFVVLGLSAGGVRSDYFGSTKSLTGVVATSRIALDQNKNAFTAGGSSATHTATTNASALNLYLCAINQAGVATTISGKGIKLYSCQIYDNGTLIRDYVPCITPSGDVGLFDAVNKQFYGNAGTGAFVAGDRVGVVLPEGYTRLTYIESTGTQYIDTGIIGKTGIKATGKFMPKTLDSAILLGCYNPQRCYMLSFNGSNVRYGYVDWYTATVAVSANADYEFEVDFSAGKQHLKLNGTTYVSSANTTAFTNNTTIYAFAYNDNGPAGDFARCRMYSLQLYDNGTLVRDFVPCKNSGGVVGLYDLSNNAFYQNAGTGAFTAGEEIVAPATASIMVVSGNAAEYDPYTWYEFDWPTPETMTVYVLNVTALRSVFAVMASTPSVPPDMVSLMAEEANNIEKILVDINELLMKSTQVWFYSGDLFAGEV